MKSCQREECFCTDFNRHLCKDYRESRSKPKSALKRKPTGEKAVFEQIWKDRPHVCESCAKHLGNEAIATFFSHIIAKGQRKDLMLYTDNIVLECPDCHNVWQHGRVEQKVKQLSFQKKLTYIAHHDKELYAKWIFLLDQKNLHDKSTITV